MNAQVRALIVQPEGSYEIAQIHPILPVLSGLVGGPIEMICGGHLPWHAYLNEEGKIDGLALNPAATRLAHQLGWPLGDVIAGTAVFLGMDEEGAEADVPREVLDVAASHQN